MFLLSMRRRVIKEERKDTFEGPAVAFVCPDWALVPTLCLSANSFNCSRTQVH